MVDVVFVVSGRQYALTDVLSLFVLDLGSSAELGLPRQTVFRGLTLEELAAPGLVAVHETTGLLYEVRLVVLHVLTWNTIGIITEGELYSWSR